MRQAKEEKEILITYVSTQNQVADPLTKRTSPQLNKGFYPKWGLVTLHNSSGGVTDSERQTPGHLPASQGRRRTSETSSVSAREACIASEWLKGSYPMSCQASTRFFSNPFQFVSRCFTFAVSPCLLALILIDYTYKIVIVPSTTLPMTNNLSFQGVLGGAQKICQRLFCRFCGFLSVLSRRGPTRISIE